MIEQIAVGITRCIYIITFPDNSIVRFGVITSFSKISPKYSDGNVSEQINI